MRILAASLVLSLTLPAAVAGAQGGTLRGVVKDSSDRPIPNVEVVATPGPHRTRTDSTGHFAMTGLGGGQYIVHARKVGYSPGESTADLHGDGALDLTVTLEHRMADLDTVVVNADGTCPERSFDGFLCRQKRGGKGVFMDYMDIDDKDPLSTADLFRDIPGFRVDVRPTRNGNRRIPVATGLHCLVSLVDGRPATAANFIPDIPGELMALEVYPLPDDVPKEYQRYMWDSRAGQRCGLAVYWDLYANLSSR
jgi:Carboxypeptidase regulatory-like domain